MFTHKTFDTGQVRIAYAQGPASGPPMVFLHGVTRSWTDLLMLLPAFVGRFTVYALDHRGHGASGRAAGKYRVMDYVRDVVSFLTIQMTEPVVIYGHSLGAMVAAGVAAEAQSRVCGLVLEDPPFQTMGSRMERTQYPALFTAIQRITKEKGEAREIARRMADVRLPAVGELKATRLGDVRDEAALRFASRCLTQLDPDVLTPILDGSWQDCYECRTVFRRMACPTLLLQADTTAGGMLADVDVALARELVADLSVVRFAGVSHQMHWTATSAILSAAMAFVESLRV